MDECNELVKFIQYPTDGLSSLRKFEEEVVDNASRTIYAIVNSVPDMNDLAANINPDRMKKIEGFLVIDPSMGPLTRFSEHVRHKIILVQDATALRAKRDELRNLKYLKKI